MYVCVTPSLKTGYIGIMDTSHTWYTWICHIEYTNLVGGSAGQGSHEVTRGQTLKTFKDDISR